jgi:uncharacterized membrane protein
MILLIAFALIALFILVSIQAGRITALEQALARLGEPESAPDPDPEVVAPLDAEAPGWPAVPHEEEQEEVGQAEARESIGNLFERLVGGRLLIWIGGIALVVAALLLIRHSIEIGLLTPAARMVGAAVFGAFLVAAGEYARIGRWLSDDVRVSQALVGAGIIILYATPYGSHILYGLIDTRTASALMIAVTAAALFLSLRHGAATALMGLIGGFLTPLLIGDPDAGALPLLIYLALLNAAIFALALRRGWTWLAAASVVLSFLWTASLLGRPPFDAYATGLFIIALALAAALVARPGRELRFVQPLAIGLVELAFLVVRVDLGFAAWALFGALAAASVALALLRSEHRFAPPAALTLALACIAAKANLGDPALPWAAAATTLLFAGYAIPLAPRGDRLLRTAIAAAALAGPFLILRIARPELLQPAAWGLLALALAAAAFLLAWLQRDEARGDEAIDPPLLLAAASATLLLCAAASDLLPADLLPAGWVAAALATSLFGRAVRDRAFLAVAVAAALLAAAQAALLVPGLWATMVASLGGQPAIVLTSPWRASLVLALPAGLLLLLTALLGVSARRAVAATAGVFALAALYVWAKQLFAIEDYEEFKALGLAERTAITQALFLLGWLLASGRSIFPGVDPKLVARIGAALTLVAALRLIWFDMLLHNPILEPQWVGDWPILNLVLASYLLGAFWLYLERRRSDEGTRSGFWLVAFLAAALAGAMLEVRQLLHGGWLDRPEIFVAEAYGYSLAGLVLSLALLIAGFRLPDKALRLAGLILLTATILKVFLSDFSALEGVLRILSFLGLGIALIGIGRLYGPVLRAEAGRAGKQMVGATGFEPATPTPPV